MAMVRLLPLACCSTHHRAAAAGRREFIVLTVCVFSIADSTAPNAPTVGLPGPGVLLGDTTAGTGTARQLQLQPHTWRRRTQLNRTRGCGRNQYLYAGPPQVSASDPICGGGFMGQDHMKPSCDTVLSYGFSCDMDMGRLDPSKKGKGIKLSSYCPVTCNMCPCADPAGNTDAQQC